jgi:UrcA family protein
MNTATATNSRKSLPAGLAALAGAAFLVSALTCNADTRLENGRTVRTLAVDYSDLDLTDAGGLQTLYSRLERAADRVCGGAPSVRESWARPIYRQCFEQALGDAVLNIGNPTLQAVHESATRRSTAG